MDHPRELYVRALALPGALAGAYLAVAAVPGPVRMLSMWVHESGHASAAWMTGFAAFPGPWFTPVDLEPSPLVTLAVAGVLAAGAYAAWQIGRWFWFLAASGLLLLALAAASALHPLTARQLITFAGDGGCFVFGAVLMLTMYARADHPLRLDGLRWAFLVVGALAFMDARATWFGNLSALPLGEDERGLSDASVLTESYGWTLAALVGRYQQVAKACFVVLAAAYAAGLWQLLGEERAAATSSSPSSSRRSYRTASTR